MQIMELSPSSLVHETISTIGELLGSFKLFNIIDNCLFLSESEYLQNDLGTNVQKSILTFCFLLVTLAKTITISIPFI